MALTPKVAFLLLGLLIGGAVGYMTRPEAAELKLGGASIEIQDTKSTASSSDSLTTGQTRHVFTYAVAGGIIGLLAGFAIGRRG